MARRAYRAGQIFDGRTMQRDAAVLVEDGRCRGVVAEGAIPSGYDPVETGAWCLAPGFVDLQVNGGGGVQFGQEISVEAIETICGAHGLFGTTSVMVTLITDTPENTAKALDCAVAAQAARTPGFLGIHFEGPHLSLAKKGAHHPGLIRPMSDADFAFLVNARQRLDHLMVTLAPESVTEAQVRALAEAGVPVSLGHTACDSETADRYTAAGARLATHLFNAMSQLDHRRPGLAAAILLNEGLTTGLIADGIHVHPDMIRLAAKAMGGVRRMFLVTDAMAPIGTDMADFTLNGRKIFRKNGTLKLADGTLAGADIDMIASIRWLHRVADFPLEEVLAMATSIPAHVLGVSEGRGTLDDGAVADIVAISEDFEARILSHASSGAAVSGA